MTVRMTTEIKAGTATEWAAILATLPVPLPVTVKVKVAQKTVTTVYEGPLLLGSNGQHIDGQLV